MFVDQKSEQCLIPLNEQIDPALGRLELANSESAPPDLILRLMAGSLSEMAVLGELADVILPKLRELKIRFRSRHELGETDLVANLGGTIRRLHERRPKHD